MIGLAARRRYWNISLECHLPRIWMMSLSTLATNKAIAPASCRYQAETSEAIKPKSEPKSWTAVQRVLVMRAGVTDWVLEPVPVYT